MARKSREWESVQLIVHSKFPSYMNILISTWVLLAAGLGFSLPMIYLRVKDTSLADEVM